MNYDTKFDEDAQALDGYDARPFEMWAKFLNLKNLFIILGSILAALSGLYLLMNVIQGQKGGAVDQFSQSPSITVIVPGSGNIEGEILATGTLAARREMPVGVVGEGGRIVSIPVEQGQWVQAGQLLASIDRSVQLQQALSAAAQIDVAEADAELAETNLERGLQLVERGFVSKADIDRLTATRDAARARTSVAEAQYRELLARNARLNVVAPATGLLLERNVELGQTVSAASGTLFRIAKGGEMEALAQVGDGEINRLAVGKDAEIKPVGTDQIFTGQIWQIEPIINQSTRTGTVRIALDYSPALRPGGFVTAQIKSGTINAPLLPESAVLSDESGSFVFIVDIENRARKRAVTTGVVTEDGIVITEGLEGSEKVVLRAGGFLSEGEVVSPVQISES